MPLHTVQLGAADQAIADVNLVDMELTRNEKYIANAMGVKVPFLPVCGKDERSSSATSSPSLEQGRAQNERIWHF